MWKERPNEDVKAIWDAFLEEWPVERLRRMSLAEYSNAGDTSTFTFWIESRLDQVGSIWGGSAFKFGIYSRRDKSQKESKGGASYTVDYGWYTKYGTTPEEAFQKVRSLVVAVAAPAADGNYHAIDAVDLGEAYKWKIAFHYQDRDRPGVVPVFLKKNLRKWLEDRTASVPSETSEMHRRILELSGPTDLVDLGRKVWNETFVPDDETEPNGGEKPPGQEPEPPEPEAAQPLNLVLYGPPGTGKTFVTSEMAVRICDGVIPEGREALMARYRELRALQRIRFVTFHPSFSYEEFIEGIRPSATEDGQLRYEIRAGVFKQAAIQARELYERPFEALPPPKLQNHSLFKMSLGDTSRPDEAWIFGDCVSNGYVCLGFTGGIDFSATQGLEGIKRRYLEGRPEGRESDFAIQAIHRLKNEVSVGDLILISYGNRRFRGLAEVTGEYRFVAREEGYEHQRPVRWLWTSEQSLPSELVYTRLLSQMSIYQMDPKAVRWDALQELVLPRRPAGQAPNCALIIDEINRANLAKTFGELITLLEPSKRLGGPDAQEAVLPYSGDRFGVPPNLYVIGTMNTADRSIALMDTALRRRFSFKEMPPQPSLLAREVETVDLQKLLRAMNLRIEALFDRDHVLGHTYFMDIATFADLVERLTGQIIPLLQEYFFEDWGRIQKVFNDVEQPPELQIIQNLDATEQSVEARGAERRYRVSPSISPAAVRKVYG